MGKMSAFQRAQMYSLQDANIFTSPCAACSTTRRDIVKAVSGDHAFKARFKIGAGQFDLTGRASLAAQVITTSAGISAPPGRTTKRSISPRSVGQFRQYLRWPLSRA